jgi:hypothetical protein
LCQPAAPVPHSCSIIHLCHIFLSWLPLVRPIWDIWPASLHSFLFVSISSSTRSLGHRHTLHRFLSGLRPNIFLFVTGRSTCLAHHPQSGPIRQTRAVRISRLSGADTKNGRPEGAQNTKKKKTGQLETASEGKGRKRFKSLQLATGSGGMGREEMHRGGQ